MSRSMPYRGLFFGNQPLAIFLAGLLVVIVAIRYYSTHCDLSGDGGCIVSTTTTSGDARLAHASLFADGGRLFCPWTWVVFGGGFLLISLATLWAARRQAILSEKAEKQARLHAEEIRRLQRLLDAESTAHRQAADELTQSEALFGEVFHHAALGIGVISPAGEWLRANPALCALTGFSEQEIRSRRFVDILHSDDVQHDLAQIGQMLAGQISTFDIEQRLQHKNGRYFWALLNVSQVRDNDGRLHYLVCQILDISERRQALDELRREKRFSENIINSSVDGIVAFDRDGRFTLWNPGMERMTGISSKAAVGRPAGEVLHFLNESDEEHAFRLVLAGQQVTVREKQFSIPETGRHGFYETRYASLTDEEGGISGGVAVVHDVTLQMEAREELATFAAALEQRNRELQDFAYVASHDLQEPLRKILAFGGRLRDRLGANMDETARDYLQRVFDAARRMQALIDDLLAFSRVSTEGKPFAQVDLNEVVGEVIRDIEAAIEQAGAVVETEPLPDIDADATQIRQLLQNLLSNAIKYRQPGTSPHVRVHGEIINDALVGGGSSPEEPLLRLNVADNGIGFDEKYLDRIFTVFQRLHGRNEYEGTGVGLAICRKIVERHGGRITARSAPGKGSTFIVTLPLRQHSGPNATL